MAGEDLDVRDGAVDQGARGLDQDLGHEARDLVALGEGLAHRRPRQQGPAWADQVEAAHGEQGEAEVAELEEAEGGHAGVAQALVDHQVGRGGEDRHQAAQEAPEGHRHQQARDAQPLAAREAVADGDHRRDHARVGEHRREQAGQDRHPRHQPALARDAAPQDLPREHLRGPRAGERMPEDVHAGDEDDGLGAEPLERHPRGQGAREDEPTRHGQGHQVVPHHLGHEEHEGEGQQGQDDEDGVDQGHRSAKARGPGSGQARRVLEHLCGRPPRRPLPAPTSPEPTSRSCSPHPSTPTSSPRAWAPG